MRKAIIASSNAAMRAFAAALDAAGLYESRPGNYWICSPSDIAAMPDGGLCGIHHRIPDTIITIAKVTPGITVKEYDTIEEMHDDATIKGARERV